MWLKVIFSLPLLSFTAAFFTVDPGNLHYTIAIRANKYAVDAPISPGDGGMSLNASGFVPGKPVCITIHGFEGNYTDGFNQHMTLGLLANKKDNQTCFYLVRCDYSYYSRDNYLVLAYDEIPQIGNIIGNQLIGYLNQNGVPLLDIRVLGFSFGCIAAGRAGYAQNGKVGIIDCMDHAGFAILPPPLYPYYLTPKNAVLVRSILCSNVLGTTYATGLYNYIINTGKQQPQCAEFKSNTTEYARCNHLQCYRFFATTLALPMAYPAYTCPSLFAAENSPGECDFAPSTFVAETSRPSLDKQNYSANITGCRLSISCPTQNDF